LASETFFPDEKGFPILERSGELIFSHSPLALLEAWGWLEDFNWQGFNTGIGGMLLSFPTDENPSLGFKYNYPDSD
jgi:hypothetical protein